MSGKLVQRPVRRGSCHHLEPLINPYLTPPPAGPQAQGRRRWPSAPSVATPAAARTSPAPLPSPSWTLTCIVATSISIWTMQFSCLSLGRGRGSPPASAGATSSGIHRLTTSCLIHVRLRTGGASLSQRAGPLNGTTSALAPCTPFIPYSRLKEKSAATAREVAERIYEGRRFQIHSSFLSRTTQKRRWKHPTVCGRRLALCCTNAVKLSVASRCRNALGHSRRREVCR